MNRHETHNISDCSSDAEYYGHEFDINEIEEFKIKKELKIPKTVSKTKDEKEININDKPKNNQQIKDTTKNNNVTDSNKNKEIAENEEKERKKYMKYRKKFQSKSIKSNIIQFIN